MCLWETVMLECSPENWGQWEFQHRQSCLACLMHGPKYIRKERLVGVIARWFFISEKYGFRETQNHHNNFPTNTVPQKYRCVDFSWQKIPWNWWGSSPPGLWRGHPGRALHCRWACTRHLSSCVVRSRASVPAAGQSRTQALVMGCYCPGQIWWGFWRFVHHCSFQSRL